MEDLAVLIDLSKTTEKTKKKKENSSLRNILGAADKNFHSQFPLIYAGCFNKNVFVKSRYYFG